MEVEHQIVVGQVQLIQVVENHADLDVFPAVDGHFAEPAAGVVDHVIALLQGNQQVPVVAVLKGHVLQLVILEVEPLNHFLVRSAELVDLHLAVPGLVDIAVSGDVDPQLPVLQGILALVAQRAVDGLPDQVHHAAFHGKGTLQPCARAVRAGVDVHVGRPGAVVAVDLDLAPVKPDHAFYVNDQQQQGEKEKYHAELP